MQRKPCGTLEPLPLQGNSRVPRGGAEPHAAERTVRRVIGRLRRQTIALTTTSETRGRPRTSLVAKVGTPSSPAMRVTLRGRRIYNATSVRGEQRANPWGRGASGPRIPSRRAAPLSAETLPSRALVKLVARPRRLTRV